MSLGDQLRNNIQVRKEAKAAANRLKNRQAQAEFERRQAIAATFFEKAKAQFTEKIQGGAVPSDLRIQVGGHLYTSHLIDTHTEFAKIFDGYSHITTDTPKGRQPQPKSLHTEYAQLWGDFQLWAQSNGLVAHWEPAWDGGGMDSWWILVVFPAP